MIGIYKITNPKGKIYIGQAIDIKRRENEYRGLHCKGQIKLYRSLVKYGFSEHIFKVIEECRVEELNIRERHWQDFYNVLEEGLNLKLTHTNTKTGKQSKETIDKISQKIKKGIVQYDSSGEFIREWSSIKHAGESLNLDRSQISACCKGLGKSVGGFIFLYKKDYTGKILKRDGINGEKPILQYSKKGELIQEWKSINMAADTLKISRSNISSCLIGNTKSANNFIWKYRENDIDSYIPTCSIRGEKPVAQYDLGNIFIKKWQSAIEASAMLGISRSSISACLVGKQKTAGKFIWKYLKEN